jgi:hypothetical protein
MTMARTARWALALWIILGLQQALAQKDQSWVSMRPIKAPQGQSVLIKDKPLLYYPLEKGQTIEIIVQGPTTLRVLSRLEFGTNTKGEKRYEYSYESDEGHKGDFQHVVSATGGVVLSLKPEVHLGNGRNVYLKIPEGKHTYKFTLAKGAAERIFLRFYGPISDVAELGGSVVFQPARSTNSVSLIINEQETVYYRIGPKDSLTVSVIGPTTLEALCRLEFDASMTTDQRFRVRVLENGIEKKIISLHSGPSQAAEYKDKSDKIAGRAARLFVEVPRGKHDFTFEVLDNNFSILMRFSIPRKDLVNNL